MTVVQAFNFIDQDSSGIINLKEFKQFIKSCELDLNEKEINQLVSAYVNIDGLISIEAFKNKFWEAYTCYGRDHGSQ